MSKIMGRFVEILGAFLENFQRKLKWIYTVRFMVSNFIKFLIEAKSKNK